MNVLLNVRGNWRIWRRIINIDQPNIISIHAVSLSGRTCPRVTLAFRWANRRWMNKIVKANPRTRWGTLTVSTNKMTMAEGNEERKDGKPKKKKKRWYGYGVEIK